jgi:hypothetical protein
LVERKKGGRPERKRTTSTTTTITTHDGGGATDEDEGGLEEKTKKKRKKSQNEKQPVKGNVSCGEEEEGKDQLEAAKKKPVNGRVAKPAKSAEIDVIDAIEIEDSEEEDDKDSSTRKAQAARASAIGKQPNLPQFAADRVGKPPPLGPARISIKIPDRPRAINVRRISNGTNSSRSAVEDDPILRNAPKKPKEKSMAEFLAESKNLPPKMAKRLARKLKRRDKRRDEQLAKRDDQNGVRVGPNLDSGALVAGAPFWHEGLDVETEDPQLLSDNDGEETNDDEGLEINLEFDKLEEGEPLDSPAEEGEAEGDGAIPPIMAGTSSLKAIKTEEMSSSGAEIGAEIGAGVGASTDAKAPEIQLLESKTAREQTKYFTAYVPPPLDHEESRPLFQKSSAPQFRVDLTRITEMAIIQPIPHSLRKCNVCMLTGHSGDTCETLKVCSPPPLSLRSPC